MALDPIKVSCPRCVAVPDDPCKGSPQPAEGQVVPSRYHIERHRRAREVEALPKGAIGQTGVARIRKPDKPHPGRHPEATEITSG